MTAESNTPGRVLVTGGASGLGAAVVDAVLKAGGTPVVLDRDISNVSAVKAFEGCLRCVFVEDHHGVHAFHGQEQFGPVVLADDGTLRTLQPPHGIVRVQADDQAVPQLTGGGQ